MGSGLFYRLVEVLVLSLADDFNQLNFNRGDDVFHGITSPNSKNPSRSLVATRAVVKGIVSTGHEAWAIPLCAVAPRRMHGCAQRAGGPHPEHNEISLGVLCGLEYAKSP